MSFYLTLPSDSSQLYFDQNTVSHFITQLPTPITLNGEWEVGLSEIIYPHTWYNIHNNNNQFAYTLGDKLGAHDIHKRKVPPGYYETIPELLNAMALPTFKDKIIFQFNDATKKVKIITKKGAEVIFQESDLARLLGFEPKTVITGSNISNYVVDLNQPYMLMYVYSDIVSPQIVGNVQAPLLRVVTVTGKDGETVSAHYDRPHYLPLARNTFNTIEIDLRLNSGEFVPFERGKVIVVLHFRAKQIL